MTQESHPPYTQDPMEVPGGVHPYPEQPGSFSWLPRFIRRYPLHSACSALILTGSLVQVSPLGDSSPAFASAESSPSVSASAQPQPDISTPEAIASPTEIPTPTASPSETTNILPAATPTPTATPTTNPDVPFVLNYTGATQNLRSSKNKHAAEGAKRVIESAGFAAFQEVKTWVWKKLTVGGYLCNVDVDKNKGETIGNCRYQGYYPQLPEEHSVSTNMIAWDTQEYALTEFGYSILNHPSNKLEDAAGGTDISLRLLPHVTLRPKELGEDTDVRIVVWDPHMVASVDKKGKANTDHPTRRKMFAEQNDVVVESRQEYDRIRHKDFPNQITIHVILGDWNYDGTANLRVYNNGNPDDDDKSSPIATCVERLGMSIINLDPKAPKTGTLPKTGDREVDLVCVTDNEEVQTTLTSFTYFPRDEGENAGSNDSDHIGIKFGVEATGIDRANNQH